MSKAKFTTSRRSAESAARQFGDTALDNRVPVATPENVAFRYEVAGPFSRSLALIIDLFILALIYFLLTVIALALGVGSSFVVGEDGVYAAMGLMMMAGFFIAWFYSGVLETFWNGRTVGKYALSLRVLTSDGRPINGTKAMLRNFFRLADLMPPAALGTLLGSQDPYFMVIPCAGVGLVVMACNRKYQRLGDLIAGTIVIHEQRKSHRTVDRFEDPRVVQLAEYIPASFVVSNELAGTLSMYAQRREFFSPERTREIAAHLGVPLLEEFGLPADTSHDLLLCALYYRTFLATENRKEIEWNPPQLQVQPSGSHLPPQAYPQTPAQPTTFGTPPPGYGSGGRVS